MKTYKRKCKVNQRIEYNHWILNLVKGEEYITSKVEKGVLVVFSNYWAYDVPAKFFNKPKRFT